MTEPPFHMKNVGHELQKLQLSRKKRAAFYFCPTICAYYRNNHFDTINPGSARFFPPAAQQKCFLQVSPVIVVSL